jgi:hypothetical protein
MYSKTIGKNHWQLRQEAYTVNRRPQQVWHFLHFVFGKDVWPSIKGSWVRAPVIPDQIISTASLKFFAICFEDPWSSGLGCSAQHQRILGSGAGRTQSIDLLNKFGQALRIPGSSPSRTRPLYLHMFTSAARLVYQRPRSVCIACTSCTKIPWYHLKRGGGSSWSQVPILAEVRITGPQWYSTAVSENRRSDLLM